MKSVGTDVTRLDKEYVPEVAIANELERAALLTMYEMRGFSLSGDHSYREEALKHIATGQAQLELAAAHSAAYP